MKPRLTQVFFGLIPNPQWHQFEELYIAGKLLPAVETSGHLNSMGMLPCAQFGLQFHRFGDIAPKVSYFSQLKKHFLLFMWVKSLCKCIKNNLLNIFEVKTQRNNFIMGTVNHPFIYNL